MLVEEPFCDEDDRRGDAIPGEKGCCGAHEAEETAWLGCGSVGHCLRCSHGRHVFHVPRSIRWLLSVVEQVVPVLDGEV